MSFASESGYIPISIAQMMSIIKDNVNEQFGTEYTDETFVGTNYYKYFYALMQRLQENEVRASEIFVKALEYFNVTNERIQRPNTTHPGIQDYFLDRGYKVSTKEPLDADAGKAFICVDVDSGDDDYATVIKPAVCALVKDCVVAGVVSQGTESETIALDNGQSFDFKFNLPTKIPVLLRLTITLSANNQFSVDSPDDIKQKLSDNITARYGLGLDFEPQRYYSVVDAPWAGMVLLEWSDDAGGNWHDEIYEAEYDEIFTFGLSDIDVVEA